LSLLLSLLVLSQPQQKNRVRHPWRSLIATWVGMQNFSQPVLAVALVFLVCLPGVALLICPLALAFCLSSFAEGGGSAFAFEAVPKAHCSRLARLFTAIKRMSPKSSLTAAALINTLPIALLNRISSARNKANSTQSCMAAVLCNGQKKEGESACLVHPLNTLRVRPEIGSLSYA
jgi:hypothetical protein